jgi:hypothetical protein
VKVELKFVPERAAGMQMDLPNKAYRLADSMAELGHELELWEPREVTIMPGGAEICCLAQSSSHFRGHQTGARSHTLAPSDSLIAGVRLAQGAAVQRSANQINSRCRARFLLQCSAEDLR